MMLRKEHYNNQINTKMKNIKKLQLSINLKQDSIDTERLQYGVINPNDPVGLCPPSVLLNKSIDNETLYTESPTKGRQHLDSAGASFSLRASPAKFALNRRERVKPTIRLSDRAIQVKRHADGDDAFERTGFKKLRDLREKMNQLEGMMQTGTRGANDQLKKLKLDIEHFQKHLFIGNANEISNQMMHKIHMLTPRQGSQIPSSQSKNPGLTRGQLGHAYQQTSITARNRIKLGNKHMNNPLTARPVFGDDSRRSSKIYPNAGQKAPTNAFPQWIHEDLLYQQQNQNKQPNFQIQNQFGLLGQRQINKYVNPTSSKRNIKDKIASFANSKSPMNINIDFHKDQEPLIHIQQLVVNNSVDLTNYDLHKVISRPGFSAGQRPLDSMEADKQRRTMTIQNDGLGPERPLSNQTESHKGARSRNAHEIKLNSKMQTEQLDFPEPMRRFKFQAQIEANEDADPIADNSLLQHDVQLMDHNQQDGLDGQSDQRDAVIEPASHQYNVMVFSGSQDFQRRSDVTLKKDISRDPSQNFIKPQQMPLKQNNGLLSHERNIKEEGFQTQRCSKDINQILYNDSILQNASSFKQAENNYGQSDTDLRQSGTVFKRPEGVAESQYVTSGFQNRFKHLRTKTQQNPGGRASQKAKLLSKMKQKRSDSSEEKQQMNESQPTNFGVRSSNMQFNVQNMFPSMDDKFMTTLNSKIDNDKTDEAQRVQYSNDNAPFSQILIKHHGQDDSVDLIGSINTGRTAGERASDFVGDFGVRQASNFSPFDMQWPQFIRAQCLKIQNGEQQLKSIAQVNSQIQKIETKSPSHRRASQLSSNSPASQRNVFSATIPKRMTILKQTKQKDKEAESNYHNITGLYSQRSLKAKTANQKTRPKNILSQRNPIIPNEKAVVIVKENVDHQEDGSRASSRDRQSKNLMGSMSEDNAVLMVQQNLGKLRNPSSDDVGKQTDRKQVQSQCEPAATDFQRNKSQNAQQEEHPRGETVASEPRQSSKSLSSSDTNKNLANTNDANETKGTKTTDQNKDLHTDGNSRYTIGTVEQPSLEVSRQSLRQKKLVVKLGSKRWHQEPKYQNRETGTQLNLAQPILNSSRRLESHRYDTIQPEPQLDEIEHQPLPKNYQVENLHPFSGRASLPIKNFDEPQTQRYKKVQNLTNLLTHGFNKKHQINDQKPNSGQYKQLRTNSCNLFDCKQIKLEKTQYSYVIDNVVNNMQLHELQQIQAIQYFQSRHMQQRIMTGSLSDYESLLMDKDRVRKENFQNKIQHGVLAEQNGKRTTAVGTDMEDAAEFFREVDANYYNQQNQLYIFNKQLMSLSDADTFKLLNSQRGQGVLKSGDINTLYEMNAIEEEIGTPGTPSHAFGPYRLLTPIKDPSMPSMFDQKHFADARDSEASPALDAATVQAYNRLMSADSQQQRDIINLNLPTQSQYQTLVNSQFRKYQEHKLSCLSQAASKKYIKIRGMNTPKSKDGTGPRRMIQLEEGINNAEEIVEATERTADVQLTTNRTLMNENSDNNLMVDVMSNRQKSGMVSNRKQKKMKLLNQTLRVKPDKKTTLNSDIKNIQTPKYLKKRLTLALSEKDQLLGSDFNPPEECVSIVSSKDKENRKNSKNIQDTRKSAKNALKVPNIQTIFAQERNLSARSNDFKMVKKKMKLSNYLKNSTSNTMSKALIKEYDSKIKQADV